MELDAVLHRALELAEGLEHGFERLGLGHDRARQRLVGPEVAVRHARIQLGELLLLGLEAEQAREFAELGAHREEALVAHGAVSLPPPPSLQGPAMAWDACAHSVHRMASADSMRADLRVIGRIADQSKRYRWMILLSMAGMAAATGAFGFLASQLIMIKDVVTGSGGTDTGAIVHALGLSCLKMLAIAPLAAAGGYLSWWSGQWVANRCVMDQRNRLLEHLTRLDLAFHHELTRGDLLTRLTSDLDRMLQLQQTLYGKLLQRPVEGAVWVAVMFVMDWRVALAMTTVLVFATLLIAPVLRRTRRRSLHARVQTAENFSILEQITAGIRVIKAMGSGAREATRYAGQNYSLFEANMRLARARAQSEALTAGGVCAIVGIALGTIAALQKWGHFDTMRVVICLIALGRLITILREVQRGWNDVQEQIPAVERVYALLDRPSQVVDRAQAIPCPRPERAITVESVRFRFPRTDEDVLRGLDLTIAVGTTVALVGQTGSGKSTLLDLLPRFHDVTAGRIAIDGVDIRDLQHESLVRHVAIVQQDSFLFNDTVYSNIAYGRPEATRAQVEEAATRAHVHEAILGLEGGKGYDTVVGDRGSRLSGGQRQRVAIARALLRDAPILLLDEPTSALDADSERHVQEALAELMRGRTTVVIAHRLATIQRADLIDVLAPTDHPGHGTVLEQGTHKELVEQGGEYARLVKLQQLAV